MSPYDDAQYTVKRQIGPIMGSFAAVLITAVNKTATSAQTVDRIEFFRKIKITDFSVIVRAAPDAGSHATPTFLPKAVLTDGTNMLATLSLGTVTGLCTGAGLHGTATVNAHEQLHLRLKYTADGTAQTMGACSYDAFIEYQDRIG